ncbi:MAG: histidine--tRNA ligase [Clostridia bacterium]|nr:histidine--tRNA ligase [Clostridia bacterium]
MRILPVKGMNDYLPEEVRIRDYLQNEIIRTYRTYGFERITTPIIEDIENLDKSDGGDNLNLIFKIMKRGEKLQKALESSDPKGIADMGLRYDLTLPLTRYYAANRDKLGKPFKVIQSGEVFRAEQPQKGRLRQFVQCDIDIIGSDDISSEIELIYVTAKALLNIDINNFRIKINDRRVLNALLLSAGFKKEDLTSVCITFDKQDKIGVDGVITELTEKGFDASAVARFKSLIEKGEITLERAKEFCEDKTYAENLAKIIEASNELARGKYETVFDMSLVRGQGYYTGTVFEIESMEFGSSVGGGGRYDNLVGKFLGEDIPAVGFSIGFERIFSILAAKNYKAPGSKEKVAVLYSEAATKGENTEGGLSAAEAIRVSDSLNDKYDVALVPTANKLGKLINRLEKQGFAGFYNNGELRLFAEDRK